MIIHMLWCQNKRFYIIRYIILNKKEAKKIPWLLTIHIIFFSFKDNIAEPLIKELQSDAFNLSNSVQKLTFNLLTSPIGN